MIVNFQRGLPFRARRAALLWSIAGIVSAAQFPPSVLAADAKEPAALPENPGEPGGPRTSAVRSGVLDTKDGLTLRLSTDLGTVNIVPLEPGASPVVRYTVHIETDAHGPAAQQLLNNYSLKAKTTTAGVEITGSLPAQAPRSGNAQFWVQYEVVIPRNYSVDVSTEGGDITTGDIGGTASLQTQGGNITAGRIGVSGLREVSRSHPVAKLETEGGQIQVLDVAGDLSAFTAGGHINAGNIAGDASLHSGGGHIRAGKIGGRAELDTAGGNITVVRAEHLVNVHTGGGQIDFGEVRGSVRAQTGGGGIRVMYVSGPMEVESNAGSICLTRVADAVQASTSGGTITAWINPEATTGSGTVRLSGASQLVSGSGDIIVFLPKNLAATIEAIVVNGNEHQIEADAGLHLVFQTSGNGQLHAVATPNGGGAPLKLRTTGGKIRLQYLDSQLALHESLLREQMDRLNERMKETGFAQVSFSAEAAAPPARTAPPPPPPVKPTNTDWFDSWLDSLEHMFRGGISENPDDFLKRFTYRPDPSYPALAQRAGIQGIVKLQVKITKDGRVEVQKVLEGEPSLVDAAIDSVKRWRAKPPWLNGKPADVISTVTFNFQLH
ncbi:MAG TPA: energy transducer TonB [Candidatus Angelobacter sp.]|nr:energy transducer TonB [Candidatus Angelobacter sp.]